MPTATIIRSLVGKPVSAEVARAQVQALAQRVPCLYAILIVNICALAYTHADGFPIWQVVLVPGLLVTGLMMRLLQWLRLRPASLDNRAIARIRGMTTIFGGVSGVLILAWAMSLQRDGGAVAASVYMTGNGHVDFFVGITVVTCIFLLMHLFAASLLVAASIVGPFTATMLASGRPIEIAIAVNLLLVTAAMLYVALSFSRDFEQMVTTASDLQRVSRQNASLAVSDALTGLPNRRRFFTEIDRAGMGPSTFALIVIDLDGFKQVNDVYGHNVGDEVLIAVANRMRALLPPDTCLARLGGDEFACLLFGSQADAAHAIATSMIEACGAPILCKSFTANIGASAGLCRAQPSPDAPVRVYEQADFALFAAKRAGRGRVESFNGTHEASMMRVSRIAYLLRSVDLCSELTTAYQPVHAANGHEITSFEALVRWNNRDLGPISPDEFIPIAERTDLIFDISRHVLRTALGHAADWPSRIALKVNLSVRDLMSTTQTLALLDELRRSPVAPNRITFEITETIFAESLEQVRANVDLLRSAGCAIAIDDFGVGYSSLKYIHALSPDIIKIDRCFAGIVGQDDRTRRIIRTIVEMARNVGAISVAEGVETAEQARLLAELGCDELQGFYFSRPVGPEAAAEQASCSTMSELLHVASERKRGRVAACKPGGRAAHDMLSSIDTPAT